MTKFYVDDTGVYLGGFDGVPAPKGGIEVPHAPEDARQVWDADAKAWGAVPENFSDLQPYQFYAVLDLSGKRAALDAFLDTLDDPQKTVAKAKFAHSLVFERTNDLVLQAQTALGLTDAELDALWRQAEAL